MKELLTGSLSHAYPCFFIETFRTVQGSLPVTQQMTEMSISREDKPEPLEPGKTHINTLVVNKHAGS